VAIADWQKSLPLFVKHLEAARNEDPKPISVIDNALAIWDQVLSGWMLRKEPDSTFAPRSSSTRSLTRFLPDLQGSGEFRQAEIVLKV
jgi:hypothetical protein